MAAFSSKLLVTLVFDPQAQVSLVPSKKSPVTQNKTAVTIIDFLKIKASQPP